MATINGVEVIGDKSAHDFDLLDKNDGVNLANGIETNREATEDNHADIVRHRTDTDVHVTPEWKNSLVTKAILGLYWTAAQTADIINEISIAGGAKLVKVETLPAVGLEQTIYLVPKADPQQGDVFDEYVWVDGKYEFIGTTKANLSNYYTKVEIDYIVSQLDYKYVKSDDTTIVKLTNLNEINLQEDHYNAWLGYRGGKVTNWKFGDGTEGGYANVWANDYYLGDEKLSDIIVKSTDYASSSKAGVIKSSQNHGISVNADGFLTGVTRSAEQYNTNSGYMIISKGTLENVLENKAEEWEFTLSDGSTVTKKIVMA